ncbi:MAG: hypothetical protein IKY89_02655 [Alistipes sp.]|nr:hypothetical protein [Alistipes sp.]
MNEDRYTRNEIIADDLDDRASAGGASNIRRRIDREVVRIDEDERPGAPIEEQYEEDEVYDEDLYIEEEAAESEEESEEAETKRPKRLIDHIITGSLLTESTVPYYRYFIAIAVMCFLSIVLTFISLNTSNEHRRKERKVTTLHERSVVKDEQRYGLSSRSAVTERLKEYNIELVDLSKNSRLIEK